MFINMAELGDFKKKIARYALVISAVALIIPIPLIGFDIPYIYGLTLGTCVSIVNLYVLVFFGKLTLKRKKPFLAPLGIIIRLVIYGYAFYMSVHLSWIGGLGCFIGFMTQKLAIFYIYGIKAKYSKNRKITPELEETFAQIDKEREKKRQKREV